MRRGWPAPREGRARSPRGSLAAAQTQKPRLHRSRVSRESTNGDTPLARAGPRGRTRQRPRCCAREQLFVPRLFAHHSAAGAALSGVRHAVAATILRWVRRRVGRRCPRRAQGGGGARLDGDAWLLQPNATAGWRQPSCARVPTADVAKHVPLAGLGGRDEARITAERQRLRDHGPRPEGPRLRGGPCPRQMPQLPRRAGPGRP